MGKPNDLAACQVSPGSEWILAKVLQHDPTTGMYRLADEDVESNKGACARLTRSSVFQPAVGKFASGLLTYADFCFLPA